MLHGSICVAAVAAVGAIFPSVASAYGPISSTKRGLVFTPNETTRADDTIWPESKGLTWYYNYKPEPEAKFSKYPQSEFEFVPMLWGTPSPPDSTEFLDTVKKLIEDGLNITNVLTFNEPNAPFSWGGANMDPVTAAQIWVNNIEPLSEMGIRVGLPAMTGEQSGIPWLQNFLKECSTLVSEGSSTTKNCTYDFVTLHWYDNFEGLASHMGQYSAAFPNVTMWITEYNYANQDLDRTQEFYKMSAEYFDRMESVERYSLFGAFRSDVSNVGPNGAMLSRNGSLTDIGAWYLGRTATGVLPTDGKSPAFKAMVPQVSAALLVAFGAVFALL
ncbi:glycosyl hydrolase catalytic core-domain-containing protein [Podospora australis]|uniref:Glycosyl hydrolase catalytic core-domain-containing protein n=1 Tax=Podospora australis TaxID=1536484 RepID=A0AAN6WYQ5_9PEZI|nr:glycosyl hydrolase catalytic core-domain-containing protein [Podospora australis]